MKWVVATTGVFVSLTLFAADTGVVVIGDWGVGDANQRAVARAMETFCASDRCDFVVTVGDNFYPSGVRSTTDPYWRQRFEEVYARLDLPFFASLGNHDHYGNIQAQIDYTALSERWRMPARYYDFTRGDADFVAIDTERFDPPQRQWLTGKLAAGRSPWKIVYGHHPIYSYGSHGDSASLIRELKPLLTDAADFYLAGHDHNMQVLRKEGRTAFVVSGGGGAGVYGIRPGPKPRAIFAQSVRGFTHLRITPSRLRLRLVSAEGAVLHDGSYEK